MSEQNMLFFTSEAPNRYALIRYCHRHKIREMIVLNPSQASRGQYVCYATRYKGVFVNYDYTTIAKEMMFQYPDLIKSCSMEKSLVKRLIFYCFVDTSPGEQLTQQIFFTYGISTNDPWLWVLSSAKKSQNIIPEIHPKLLYEMRMAFGGSMVDEVISGLIKQGPLPDINKIKTYDRSDDDNSDSNMY